MSTRDESESRTEPSNLPDPAAVLETHDLQQGLPDLVALETGPAAGIESRVMLERARARLLGRTEETPGRVGRYVVLQRIGAGAMGVVLRAYDPKLRREVALKIVRPRGGLSGTEAQTRLLREAQALAQLAHPNVVAVYDAEITKGGVCIAMEFVEGQTLRAWLRERSRAWPEVLGMLMSVAHGLAAAHATGLVHRDVKPDNCLVGADGRLRVTDFGLARVTDGGSSSLGDVAAAVDHDDEPLTRDGTVMGTPPYMAPEQHEGSVADAATDQYAFGVLMWEALYGSRPFHGRTLPALTAAKRRGPPERPSKDVPRWLDEVVRRALAVRPHERWPSMPALAEALVSGRARVRKQRAMLAVVGAGLATLGFAGWQHVERHRTQIACQELGASIHRDAWNDAMRARLRAATRAETTYTGMLSWIDPYVEGWQALRTSLCVDEQVEARIGPDVAARARECLDERRDALAQLLEVLAEGGVDSRRAVTAVARLPGLEPCVDPAALARRPRLPDAPRPLTEALELRRSLQRARGLAATERDAEALELAEALSGRAAAAGLSALELETSAFAGWMAGRAGRHEAAEATLRRVVVEAGALGLDEVAADAATALVSTVGQGLGRLGAALVHAETAALLVDRVEPEGRGPRHIRLLDALARVHIEAGRDEEAQRVQARAIEMAQATLGPEHPLIADMLDVLDMLGMERAGARP